MKIKENLCINLSESLLKTLADTSKSFEETNQQPMFDEIVKENVPSEVINLLQQEETLAKNELQVPLKSAFRRKDSSTNIAPVFRETLELNIEDVDQPNTKETKDDMIVTPYSVCNLTEMEIFIEKVVEDDSPYQPECSGEGDDLDLNSQAPRRTGSFSNYKLSDIQSKLKLNKQLAELAQQKSSSSKPQKTQPKYKKMTRVPSNTTKPLEVDYEAQVRKHRTMYCDGELSNKQEEIVQVVFSEKKVPITDINLNELIHGQRHYFNGMGHKEFLVYTVSFKNLKRVLTLRTQYLLENRTLFDYQIRIDSPEKCEEKVLRAGGLLPLPESYNKSQLKLCQINGQEEKWSTNWNIYSMKINTRAYNLSFLQHGNEYTIVKKEVGDAPELQTYNIVLMPPVVLENCLPVHLHIEFVDSRFKHWRIILHKEETQNLFQLDLQSAVQLFIQVEGYSKAVFDLPSVLDSREENWEEKSALDLFDNEGRRLQLNAVTSQKSAGYKVTFHVSHLLINMTLQKFLFFYYQPHSGTNWHESDRDIMVSTPFQVTQEADRLTDVHMLCQDEQLYVKMENSADVSAPLTPLKPGHHNKFSLTRRNRLFQFGYSTDVYSVSKNEQLFTRVTTLSPHILVANCTQKTVLIAQECAKSSPLFLKPGEQEPFHWNEKDEKKLVCVRVIPNRRSAEIETIASEQPEYEWSNSFDLDEFGTITVQNREYTTDRRLLGISDHQSMSFDQQNRKKGGSLLDFLITPTKQANLSGSQNFGGHSKMTNEDSISSDDWSPLIQYLCENEKTGEKIFLKISRKLHRHQIFVIIEEVEKDFPDLQIVNNCKDVKIIYQQAENKEESELDACWPRSKQAFTWSDPKAPQDLKIMFYEHGSRRQGLPRTSQDRRLNFKKAPCKRMRPCVKGQNIDHIVITDKDLKELSRPKREILMEKETTGPQLLSNVDRMHRHQYDNDHPRIFVKVYTNVYSKILMFDDQPPDDPCQIFGEPESPAPVQKEMPKLTVEYQSSVSCRAIPHFTTYFLTIDMVNVSLVSQGVELLTLYLKDLEGEVSKSETDVKNRFVIGNLQIDNQSEFDPVCPVILKPLGIQSMTPRKTLQKEEIKDENAKPVFECFLHTKNNVPNVLYIELFRFLLQRLELKLELQSVILLLQFGARVQTLFKDELSKTHALFYAEKEDESLTCEHETSVDQSIAFEAEDDPQNTSMFSNSSRKTVQFADVLTERSQSMAYRPSQVPAKQPHTNAPVRPLRLSMRPKEMQPLQQRDSSTLEGDQYLLKQMQKKMMRRDTIIYVTKQIEAKNQKAEIKRTEEDQAEALPKGQRPVTNNVAEQVIQRFGTMDTEKDFDYLEVKEEFKRIYIKTYRGSPLSITASLMKTTALSKAQQDSYKTFSTLFSIGLTLNTFEQAPVKLNALEMQNIFGDKSEVVDQMKAYYMSSFKSNVMSVLGSSNLIGNPTKLISTLGTGIHDFYYEPIKGFDQGLIEGGRGVVKGSTSLVSNVVVGTTYSVGRITDQLSGAMLPLSGDSQYIQNRNREMIREKPTNVVDGLRLGVASAFGAGWSGLKGVVTQPVTGAQKDGITGLLKGLLTGTAGLIVKPASGVMDVVTKTSQGISNQQKSLEELELVDERIQPPRPFYEAERLMRPYDLAHANLCNLVPKLTFMMREEGRSPTLMNIDCTHFYDAWLLDGDFIAEWQVLFLTEEYVVMVENVRPHDSSSQSSRQVQSMSQDHTMEFVDLEEKKSTDQAGDPTVQIAWAQKTSDMRSVQLYNGHLLDLEFEDCRQILTITDFKKATSVTNTISSLLRMLRKRKQLDKKVASISYRSNAAGSSKRSRHTYSVKQ